MFASNFAPSRFVEEQILRKGHILAPGETPAQMIERVVNALYQMELRFTTSARAIHFSDRIGSLMDAGYVVFSTPILTNAGRQEFHRPLSACTVPPVQLRGDLSAVTRMVNTYHREAMGTGFNFDETTDPVATLLFLNDVAVTGASNGTEDRPVGNMGVCSIYHPRIVEFIQAKALRRDIPWKFNISVNTPTAFWHALEQGENWMLLDGTSVRAQELFDLIVECAHQCADPGLIFLDRMNDDNPVPGMGCYHSTAPCAEVGLIPGETCQFGYINLGRFVVGQTVDLEHLQRTVKTMTRALDNALQISIEVYEIAQSRSVMSQRRKIGIGICGLADMLIQMGIPYDSEEGRSLAQNVVAFINYHSKVASHHLALERGSFEAMYLPLGCKYLDEQGFLERKYGGLTTAWVSPDDWIKLGLEIRSSKALRHCSTIALPPTGRSGLVVNASTGVEPVFQLIGADGEINPSVKNSLGIHLTPEMEAFIKANGHLSGRQVQERWAHLKTSTQISPLDHALMVAAIQPAVDESISKTVNVPRDATLNDVAGIYLLAVSHGLKGMTTYRDGSVNAQPKKL